MGVAVLGVGVEDMFEQLPSLLGRQFEHCLLAFTQAQPLHEPVRLHLQHSTISPSSIHLQRDQTLPLSANVVACETKPTPGNLQAPKELEGPPCALDSDDTSHPN